ncbi:MAG: hypothetical protein ACQKBY_08030 [Verrucomicrobiales bacterium]
MSEETMNEILQSALLLAAWAQGLLCVGSLAIPRVLGWREKTAVLTPLMRQMWWTYAAYVWMSHVFFALVSLALRDWFVAGSLAALCLSGFIFAWWLVRLVLQFAAFDLAEIPPTPFNRAAEWLLTLLFIALTAVYGGVFGWNAWLLWGGGAG